MVLAAEPSFTEQIAPYLPFIGVVVSGLLVGGFAVWNRSRGAVETKAPSVAESWQQAAAANSELDLERRMRRWYESAFWALVEAFTGYHRRVVDGGSTALRAHEKRALDATPPNLEKEEP
jgi:hypothetical protein